MDKRPNFCSNCGVALKPGNKYCSECGKNLKAKMENDEIAKFNIKGYGAGGSIKMEDFGIRTGNNQFVPYKNIKDVKKETNILFYVFIVGIFAFVIFLGPIGGGIIGLILAIIIGFLVGWMSQTLVILCVNGKITLYGVYGYQAKWFIYGVKEVIDS